MSVAVPHIHPQSQPHTTRNIGTSESLYADNSSAPQEMAHAVGDGGFIPILLSNKSLMCKCEGLCLSHTVFAPRGNNLSLPHEMCQQDQPLRELFAAWPQLGQNTATVTFHWGKGIQFLSSRWRHCTAAVTVVHVRSLAAFVDHAQRRNQSRIGKVQG